MGANSSRIKYEKIDGFIKIYDGSRYLILFGPKRYDAIYDGTKYLISGKSGVTYSISHNFAKLRIYSYNSLPIEKTLTFNTHSYENKSYTQFF